MTEYEIGLLKLKQFETEDQFLAAAVMLISQQFPRLRDKFWHTKNEDYKRRIAILVDKEKDIWRVETKQEFEKRRMIEGGKEKAKGMRAGIMDLFILLNGVLYKLELKIKGGHLSDSQKELITVFNRDCPKNPVNVAYDLYHVYRYCEWICRNNLTIDFPNHYQPFVLI